MVQTFSSTKVKSSLYIFAAGKVIAGLIGVFWLLTLVRVLPVADYGGYVALVAVLELSLLVGNAGVYPFAQRYLTEARFPPNLKFLPTLILWSSCYRLATLILPAGLLILFSSFFSSQIGLPFLAPALVIYAVVIIFEGTARYIELAFESLLEQGRAQISTVSRAAARLFLILVLWNAGQKIDLILLTKIELCTSFLGLLLSSLLMWRAVRLMSKDVPSNFDRNPFSIRRIVRFALPLYVAQCLSQLYSPDFIKLMVSRVLGVLEAANFGFAHAITFVMQRYLPANLLIGLIRPFLVAKQANSQGHERLFFMSNLILKVNIFCLIPLAALFCVAGREFAFAASGGKYPDAGPLLFMLTLLLIFSGTHLIIGMLATVIEDKHAVLWGTFLSIPGVLLGIALIPMLGSMAMVIGLWASEIIWCYFALSILKRAGVHFRVDVPANLRVILSAGAAALTAYIVCEISNVQGNLKLVSSAALIAIVYLMMCFFLSPFNSEERHLLRRLVPGQRA